MSPHRLIGFAGVEELRYLAQQLQRLAEGVRETVWIFDIEADAFVFVDPSFDDLSGYKPEDLEDDRGLFDRLFFDEDQELAQSIFERLREGFHVVEEHRLRRADGSERNVLLKASAVADDSGVFRRFVGHFEDLAHLNRLQTLEYASRVDAHTGLSNRRGFEESLDLEWRRHLRNGEAIAVMRVDLDRIEEIDPAVREHAVQLVATELDEVAQRAPDVCARHGSSQLAALLPDTDAEGAEGLAIELLERVRELVLESPAGESQNLSVSIGIADRRPRLADEPQVIVAAAERALGKARYAGGDRFETNKQSPEAFALQD